MALRSDLDNKCVNLTKDCNSFPEDEISLKGGRGFLLPPLKSINKYLKSFHKAFLYLLSLSLLPSLLL